MQAMRGDIRVLDQKIAGVDARLVEKIDDLDGRLTTRIDSLRTELVAEIRRVDVRIDSPPAEQLAYPAARPASDASTARLCPRPGEEGAAVPRTDTRCGGCETRSGQPLGGTGGHARGVSLLGR
jgi:hypothetical protein